MQNFNRLPIISDTTKTVRPVTADEAYGPDADEVAGMWFIGINCPVDGKSLSGAGPFDTRQDAMAAIVAGEY